MDNRIHDSRVIANRLLDVADAERQAIVPSQIIKLVYLCHGWTLGLFHRPFIVEDVEAWRVGPVIRRLHELVGEGADAVTGRLEAPAGAGFTDSEENLMRQVFDVYRHFTAVQLGSLTLTRGTPWDITWRRHGAGAVIPKDLIEVHFAGLARSSGGRIAPSVPDHSD